MSIRTSITEKQIQEMNKELESLERAFDFLDVHIVITDLHGNIIYANPAAERITGFSKSEMLGKNPGDLWGGRESDEFFASMWQTIKVDKKVFRGRVHNKTKSGVDYIQEIHITPLLDNQGSVKYFVAMEPDVTLQTNLEIEVKDTSRKITDFRIAMMQQSQKISQLVALINNFHQK